MEMKVLQLKLIDSARFMATSLSNLADNLTEGIHKIKCKDCNCLLQYESAKENSIKCKCSSCNKNYTNKIDEELKKRFMDEWEKFNETLLPKKEELYSNLNMENITDADYMHAKSICKGFEIKNLSEYYDLYLKNNTLLLADVKIYHLLPAKFLSGPGLAW